MVYQGLENIHLASQYLAAAGISFLPKMEDDSHTNLGFSEIGGYFFGRPLNENGDSLQLNLSDFALEWSSVSNPGSLQLDGQHHRDVLKWLSEITASAQLSEPYLYKFHYSLPYPISDDYQFQKKDAALQKETVLRSLAQNVLAQILNEIGMESEIRTWPHHFDTGAFASLPGRSDISIGLGLAIPDTLIKDYYYYVAAYGNNGALPTNVLSPLSKGQWLQDGFTGAVLPASDLLKETVKTFFKEAITAY